MKFRIFAVALAVLAVSAVQADAQLSQGDANYVGSINDGIPSSQTREATYINNLITLAPGTGDTTIDTETYNRVGSTLVGLPEVTEVGSVKDESGSTTISLGGATYDYVLAKYDAKQAGSLVWYSATGFTGDVAIDATFNGFALSHISAYNEGDPPVVPEPASIALMGLGGLLAGYGVSRRKQKSLDDMVN